MPAPAATDASARNVSFLQAVFKGISDVAIAQKAAQEADTAAGRQIAKVAQQIKTQSDKAAVQMQAQTKQDLASVVKAFQESSKTMVAQFSTALAANRKAQADTVALLKRAPVAPSTAKAAAKAVATVAKKGPKQKDAMTMLTDNLKLFFTNPARLVINNLGSIRNLILVLAIASGFEGFLKRSGYFPWLLPVAEVAATITENLFRTVQVRVTFRQHTLTDNLVPRRAAAAGEGVPPRQAHLPGPRVAHQRRPQGHAAHAARGQRPAGETAFHRGRPRLQHAEAP
jgi:hypothetical protein